MPYTGTMHGAVQTKYFVAAPEYLPGQIAFPDNACTLNSYPVADDFALCGSAMFKGDAYEVKSGKFGANNSPFDVKLPESSTAATDFVGIMMRDTGAHNNDAGQAGRQKGDMCTLVEDGYIAVKLVENTNAGGDVYVVTDAANSKNAPAGSLAATDLSGKAVKVDRLKWWAKYDVTTQPYGIVKVTK